MKIIHSKEAIQINKPEGVKAFLYLFDDYEVHYDEQAPHTTQVGHHHEKIWETLYIIDGELIVYWQENGNNFTQILTAGDLIEVEKTPHNFVNNSDNIVRFLVIKRMPSDKDFREVFKNDKIIDEINTH